MLHLVADSSLNTDRLEGPYLAYSDLGMHRKTMLRVVKIVTSVQWACAPFESDLLEQRSSSLWVPMPLT